MSGKFIFWPETPRAPKLRCESPCSSFPLFHVATEAQVTNGSEEQGSSEAELRTEKRYRGAGALKRGIPRGRGARTALSYFA
jgi:hypothetical protein